MDRTSMADSESSPIPAPLSPKEENITTSGSKITELTESRSELLSRIQGLKEDLRSWRSKLDTQVKTYRQELSDLKESLNVEVEQLRTGFQELKSTLQQQQEDVTNSLKNLGLQDITEDAKVASKVEEKVGEASYPEVEENADKLQVAKLDDNAKEEVAQENGKETEP